MAWDSVTYEEHHEMFQDHQLWVLRHFLVEQSRADEVASPSTLSTALRQFFEQWEWACPGVFAGTELSTFVMGDRVRWRFLHDAFQRTRERIASFGEFVPASYLETRISTSEFTFTGDRRTHPLLESLDRIRRLLETHGPTA